MTPTGCDHFSVLVITEAPAEETNQVIDRILRRFASLHRFASPGECENWSGIKCGAVVSILTKQQFLSYEFSILTNPSGIDWRFFFFFFIFFFSLNNQITAFRKNIPTLASLTEYIPNNNTRIKRIWFNLLRFAPFPYHHQYKKHHYSLYRKCK